MSDFYRVKDKTTGHEFSVRVPNLDKVKVIDEPAADMNGRPLPAKPDSGPPASEFDDLKVDQLNSKIDELNATREDDKKVVPASAKKADLIAALVAAESDAGQ